MLKSYLKKIFTIIIILFISVMSSFSISGISINTVGIKSIDQGDISLIEAPFTNNYNSFFEDPPNMIWNKTYGGLYNDISRFVQQTSDDGYIIVGNSYSFGAGEEDIWVVKTDIDGNELWNKTYGGVYGDWCYCIKETSDGGFVITGGHISNPDHHYDTWTIKIDYEGNVIWDKKYCRIDAQSNGNSVIILEDGYLIISSMYYYTPSGKTDIWLIKTDFFGEEIWNKTIGNIEGEDICNAVIQTKEDDFVIVGHTFFVTTGRKVLLIKTDSNGGIIWRKTYDGREGLDIKECDDGYIIAGRENVCLIRTDKNGNLLWKKEYQWFSYDSAYSVFITPNGGYIVTGIGTYNQGDMLIFETDDIGNRIWEKVIGGPESDSGICITQSNNNTYIIAGSYYSSGNWDYWLVKVVPFENQRPSKPIIYGPNSGRPFIEYIFTVNSTEPDNEDIYFWFEWGDNTYTPWQGPFKSGENCDYSKIWYKIGTYNLNIKARDPYGGDSEWASIKISIPKIKTYIISLNLIKILFYNLIPDTFFVKNLTIFK